jgi:hypothetical protein
MAVQPVVRLPLLCAVCFGRVVEPVLCPNNHVFCERCIAAWFALGEDGRKLHAGTALFAETGELLALARQTWIVPRS